MNEMSMSTTPVNAAPLTPASPIPATASQIPPPLPTTPTVAPQVTTQVKVAPVAPKATSPSTESKVLSFIKTHARGVFWFALFVAGYVVGKIL